MSAGAVFLTRRSSRFNPCLLCLCPGVKMPASCSPHEASFPDPALLRSLCHTPLRPRTKLGPCGTPCSCLQQVCWTVCTRHIREQTLCLLEHAGVSWGLSAMYHDTYLGLAFPRCRPSSSSACEVMSERRHPSLSWTLPW